MRLFPSFVLAACLALCGHVQAQAASAAPPTGSGDAVVDARLADVGRYAAQYPEPFVDELVRYFDAPREFVAALLRQGWAPADVYYACVLGRSAGRSCRYVTDEYTRQPEGGWPALAGRLGIGPGSPGFERVRQAFAPSYERWGRPLPALPAPTPGKPVRAPRSH